LSKAVVPVPLIVEVTNPVPNDPQVVTWDELHHNCPWETGPELGGCGTPAEQDVAQFV
jgi:hypothetical protein